MIRINHLGLVAAILAVGFAAPSSAQVVTRDPCFYSREDCDARVRERTRQAEERAQRLADDRWTRDQEAKIRAEFQRDHMRDLQSRTQDQQQRTRELQERTRERQLEQARDLRERTVERAQQIRERELERSRELREREMERAQEQRQRDVERAQELRERLVERAQTQRDAVVERRVYISPPAGIRFRNRWP